MRYEEADRLATSLEQAVTAVFRHKAQLMPTCELTHSQYLVLKRLYLNGPEKVTDLAANLGVSAPAISSLLNELVQQAYVTRQEASDDRRVRLVQIAAKGEQLVNRLRQQRRDMFAQVLAECEQGDVEAFWRVFRRLLDRIDVTAPAVEPSV